MATVVSIDRAGGTPADVSIDKLDEATFQLLSTDVLPNGATRSTYTVASGDPRYPTTITIQTKLDKNGNKGRGVQSATFALNSWARVEVDSVISDIAPINAALSINIPVGVALEIADIRQYIENLYALTYATLSTNEPVNDRLSASVLFGVTQVLG